MDSRQYVEGYQQPHNRNRFNFDTPEVRKLMAGPREWASFYDVLLTSFLDGDTTDIEYVEEQLDVYEHQWLDPHLEDLIEQSQILGFYDGESASAVNELTFHILTKEFMPIWRHALLPEKYPPLSPEEITVVQTGLATRGVALKQTRVDAIKQQLRKGTSRRLAGSLNGQISEIDAAIVMLEMMKDNPSLILLPATQHFESAMHSGRSTDFVLTDTEVWQSRGIQVKTSIGGFQDPWKRNQEQKRSSFLPVKRYDDKYITMIDGMVDIGNYALRPLPNNSTIAQADPGQISVNFLSDRQHPSLAIAKNNIAGRIFHDLRKN